MIDPKEYRSEEYIVALGKAISFKRKKLGYTQQSIAQITNISINTIRNIEAGRHHGLIDNVFLLCLFLDVSLDEILYSESRCGCSLLGEEVEGKLELIPIDGRSFVVENFLSLINGLLHYSEKHGIIKDTKNTKG